MARVVTLIILLSSFAISAAAKASCDLHAAIGIRLTLPFVFEKLAHTEKLVWLHNYTVIYQRDKGKVTVGKQDDVTSSGSLVLPNPKLNSAGIYQAQVYNATGALVRSWMSFVCVMEKVPKPSLSYKCDKSSVNFNCITVKSQDLGYSWTMDDKVLTGETRPALMMPLSKLKSKNGFACTVSNQVSSEISDVVFPLCAIQPPVMENRLCFPPKAVIAVLAGVMGVNLILIIVIIALCCSRRRKGSSKSKEEPKMLYRAIKESEAEYETMHVPERSREPSPNPSPKVVHDETKTDSETKGESLQPPEPTEGPDPSPVPKPRTRRPNTPDL